MCFISSAPFDLSHESLNTHAHSQKMLVEKKLQELKEETKTLFRHQELKTQAIEKLTTRLHEYADLEERHKDMEVCHLS